MSKKSKLTERQYIKTLAALQLELVKLQEWVKSKGLRVVVLFEGRDAAGKGGVIKRITEALNPRICRVVALGVPTEKEQTQWYFQRYAAQLPSAGEIVLFDRSWYNRAGVERVMGFCTEEQYKTFFDDCPRFEELLTASGIILIKYWLSVTKKEQEKRLRDRLDEPAKNWKFSQIDFDAYSKWDAYTEAISEMFARTSTKNNPWWIVKADKKKKARLNCILHLLSRIPYGELEKKVFKLPDRGEDEEDSFPKSVKKVPEKY